MCRLSHAQIAGTPHFYCDRQGANLVLIVDYVHTALLRGLMMINPSLFTTFIFFHENR